MNKKKEKQIKKVFLIYDPYKIESGLSDYGACLTYGVATKRLSNLQKGRDEDYLPEDYDCEELFKNVDIQEITIYD